MGIDRRWRGVVLAIAVALVGGASTCSDAPTAPISLDGRYFLVSIDGGLPPVTFEPFRIGPRLTVITGASLDVIADTMFLTTTFMRVDGTTDQLVGPPWTERAYYWPYYRIGDSLYFDGYGGPVHFATIEGLRLNLRADYPLPPSEGYPSAIHYIVFAKF